MAERVYSGLWLPCCACVCGGGGVEAGGSLWQENGQREDLGGGGGLGGRVRWQTGFAGEVLF